MAKKKSSKQILKSATSGRKNLQDPAIVEKKNRRDLSKVTGVAPLMEKEVYNAIDALRAGQDTDTITAALQNTINPRTKRKYAPRFVENIVTTANQLIQMWYRNQIYQIEQVHVTRYNRIIIDRLNKSYAHIEKPWIAAKAESMHLEEILQAMKQKETLLGMHRKTFRLIFNSQINFYESERQKTISEKEKKKSINLELLSFEEKIELLELIKLSSRTDDEIHGVILREKKIEEETIDIEAEVVEEANVAKIEQFVKEDKTAEKAGSILEEIQRKLLEKSKNT